MTRISVTQVTTAKVYEIARINTISDNETENDSSTIYLHRRSYAPPKLAIYSLSRFIVRLGDLLKIAVTYYVCKQNSMLEKGHTEMIGTYTMNNPY